MTQKPTACLALADGTIFYGMGFGATGETVAELCFNTAMTGYQEIMTDPTMKPQTLSPKAWSSSGIQQNRRTGARPTN